MYVTKIVKKDVEETHKVCDICGNQIQIGLACSSIKCQQCKRDLCEECIGHEESTPGDYRYGYCKDCWDIGQEYLLKIEKLSMRIDNLHHCWNRECLEYIKNEETK